VKENYNSGDQTWLGSQKNSYMTGSVLVDLSPFVVVISKRVFGTSTVINDIAQIYRGDDY
jgi:hypothetical protein